MLQSNATVGAHLPAFVPQNGSANDQSQTQQGFRKPGGEHVHSVIGRDFRRDQTTLGVVAPLHSQMSHTLKSTQHSASRIPTSSTGGFPRALAKLQPQN